MQKPNYALMSRIVVLAVLAGIIGGGVMGGIAGYYAAQSAAPVSVVADPIVAANVSLMAQPVVPMTTSLTPEEESAVVKAVHKTKPAVVTIVNQSQSRRGLFGGTSSGSGVIIDAKGYIVTNNHVIEGGQGLQVIFADGNKVDATVVGADSGSDLAVIRVNATVPAVAPLGNSNALEPGQVAIAIGNPLGDYHGTVTVGVVSGLNRRVGRMQGLIQTDAAINSGNSGGPLINTQGQVIGITTLVVRSTNGGSIAEGLGFAIPSNYVREIVGQLIAKGRIERPFMGIAYQEVDPQIASALNLGTTQGVVVIEVVPDSPAAKAGIREHDVLLALDAQSINQEHPLSSMLLSYKAGDTVMVTVHREGKQMQIRLTLGMRPAQ